MAITAADVNKLRQITGAGMMDCKNALTEANGDFDAAIDILRKKGQKVAAKRADRASNEGRVIAKTNDAKNFAAMLTISCETDFVGKNSEFIDFTEKIINAAMANGIKSREDLLELEIDGRKVADLLIDMTGKTGEKVELPEYNVIEAPCVAAYNHNGNRLGSIIGLSQAGCEKVGHEVAMQIAAMNPIALDQSSVSQETIDHELEIARDITRQEGKPEDMVEKIAQGKLNKFFKENTLLSQDFIMNSKISVADYLKEANADLKITTFFRFQLGA
ncbi:translation elongation factor Ts [Bacteroidales bacterium OttesenSCG-928-B11]|nr:translation elongation factor Ts [Bacteroidales bacterium OttesenSCG-928-C03]MDL2311604.1 translation elongation factor Ts [Bacteroidales bacterium OttesenSCG-928-B11]MDL2326229.1 translation elongation factor Ts [Bacteroidales bacterium OttesenSCG-928-A14]